MKAKAEKKGFEIEDAQRHIDNLFDVRVYLSGGSGFYSPYQTPEVQKLVNSCTEALEFLLKVKEFGDEITRAVHGN